MQPSCSKGARARAWVPAFAPALVLAASACGKPAVSPAAGAASGEASPAAGGSVAVERGGPDARAAGRLSTKNASGYRWGSVTIGGGGFVSGLIPPRDRAGAWFARTDVGGAYRYDAAAKTWVPLLDWVSDEQTGFLGVESIALDPSDPGNVYLLVGIGYFHQGKTAVLRSKDSGASFELSEVTSQFTAHGNGMGRQSGERLAVDPGDGNVLLVGTRSRGLFRSEDRGASFRHVDGLNVSTTPNGNGVAFVLFDRRGSAAGPTQRVYLGVSRPGAESLFASGDGGRTWKAIPGQPKAFTPQRAALSSAGALYVTYGNGPGPHPTNTDAMDRGAIWKLDTATGAWTEITPLRGADNRAFCGISVDASNPARILSTTVNTYLAQPWGNGDRLFLSTDAGATWTDLIGSERLAMDTNGFPWIQGHSIHWAGSVEIDPFEPERAFVVSGNGVFMTENLSGTPSSWKFQVDGLEETVPLDAVSVPGGSFISVIGDYDGFVHDDLGRSPGRGKHDPSMGTTRSLALAAQKPGTLARVGKELYLSTDGAAHWALVPRPSQEEGGKLALSADGSVLLWSSRSVVHRTADAGKSWTRADGLGFEAAPAADAVDAGTFYAYDPRDGAFYTSRDAGQSFQRGARLSPGGGDRIQPVPGRRGEVWVPLHEHGLWRSTSAGGEFERVAPLASCQAVGFGAPAPGRDFPAVYVWGATAGGPRGIYRSDDRGASWLRINDDAHQYGGPGNGQFVLGDANVYGRVYMSTAGRGIVYGQLD
jgi:xyloglucan-specific exo-beta-1,4-glucanase